MKALTAQVIDQYILAGPHREFLDESIREFGARVIAIVQCLAVEIECYERGRAGSQKKHHTRCERRYTDRDCVGLFHL